jgi:hypothetical protein
MKLLCIGLLITVKARGLYGGTPVYWAAMGRQPDAINTLHSLGCNINTTNDRGESPIYAAAVTVCHPQTVEALTECGAVISERVMLHAVRISYMT